MCADEGVWVQLLGLLLREDATTFAADAAADATTVTAGGTTAGLATVAARAAGGAAGAVRELRCGPRLRLLLAPPASRGLPEPRRH